MNQNLKVRIKPDASRDCFVQLSIRVQLFYSIIVSDKHKWKMIFFKDAFYSN